MFGLKTLRDEGLNGEFAAELLRDTHKVGKSALSKGAAVLAKRMREKLNVRGGPSVPGSPPARVTGNLRKAVGRDRPRRDGDKITVAVGVGVGKSAERKAIEMKAQGENVFASAVIHEFGGIGAGGRRYPARPFARPAELEAEAEIEAAIVARINTDGASDFELGTGDLEGFFDD